MRGHFKLKKHTVWVHREGEEDTFKELQALDVRGWNISMWEVRLEKAKAAAWRMFTFSVFTCSQVGLVFQGL